MPFLPDTNIIIEILRRRDSALLSRLAGVPLNDLNISVVVLGELMVAVEKGHADNQRTAIQRFRDVYPTIGIDERTALNYASIRAQLEQRGETIGANDLWIAAQAKARNLTVVTANTREFERVEGLNIENWRSTNEDA